MPGDCPFCAPNASQIIFESTRCFGLWDGFPVSDGHALVVPRRHVATWFDATPEEQSALLESIERVRHEIVQRYHPDGFNIGINVGAAAGQTVFHLHIHVIPRYQGDVPDPRGGVRHVIPLKANYLRRAQAGAQFLGDIPHDGALIRGTDDPLLPHFLAHLHRATSVDICVAFVQLSGLRLIGPHFRDILSRDGRIRFLTGDYLDITDPRALTEICDLSGEFPGAKLDLRVFEAGRLSFHPKGYIFHFPDGSATALVGSSNLTESALRTGIEWNYRVVTSESARGLGEVQAAFQGLWEHPSTKQVTPDWIRDYIQRRSVPTLESGAEIAIESPEKPPEPHPIQQEALLALESTRRDGNTAGLVVLATGLGKTWLSAFDSNRPEFARILFVAHREEILSQALHTFRCVRPEATLGRYTGTEKFPEADVLFASIQTLGRQTHLNRFARDRFDYIVIDEFHHASALTYRNLINHFTPKYLLGLTATPERTDGGDLLALCQENLVYRCDVDRGITDGQLVPFHYFGVPDEVDYRNIPWRNNRFDEAELTRAVATQKRAQNALEQYRRRIKPGSRTLAFCCSQRHCDFMADFFGQNGLRAVSVHSSPNSFPRAAALELLSKGQLDIVCAVDMFNEGVDVPSIDTVLMLRPTESTILWTQQFGRGLRTATDKTHLTVIDYIGNHRIFLAKARTLLNLSPGYAELDRALNLLVAGAFALPPGCEVTYDLEAIENLRNLLPKTSGMDAVKAVYLELRERTGQRPTATEMFHEGYNPRTLRSSHGSWLRFVRSMGDLTQSQQAALADEEDFLSELERTQMTKSFKMLTLLAMLDEDAFPGTLSVEVLTAAFARRARRAAVLQRDVGDSLKNSAGLVRLIESNPISAWTGGRGTRGRAFFTYANRQFSSRLSVAPENREAFQELVRELAEWRLAEYLSRPGSPKVSEFTCKVSHANGRPILFLPDRAVHPHIPEGWAPVEVDGRSFEANFVKVAVNVMREPGRDTNALPDILTEWFGPDAGRPGTFHRVVFEPAAEGFRLRPAKIQPAVENASPELWHTYNREEIPPLFGLPFSEALWNVGFVPTEERIFLLITLDKDDLAQGHQYADRFLAKDHFQMQSQNRTSQQSKHGLMMRHHEERGIEVHLFVRRSKKIQGKAAPFHYCGQVTFIHWTGDRPITVDWRLRTPVPERFYELFRIHPTSL